MIAVRQGDGLEEWVRCKEAISYRGPLLDVCSEIGKFSYNQQFVYGVDTAVAFIF